MKINIIDNDELNAAIAEVAGKAHQHVHTGHQVRRTAEALHAKLCRHLPKRLLVGSHLKLSSQPVLPKAYGSRMVIHTEILVEICASGLFVTEITRIEAWATSQKHPAAWAILPEAVKDALKSALYIEASRI